MTRWHVGRCSIKQEEERSEDVGGPEGWADFDGFVASWVCGEGKGRAAEWAARERLANAGHTPSPGGRSSEGAATESRPQAVHRQGPAH